MGTVKSLISPWAATLKVTENEARLALGAGWAKAPGSAYQAETGVVESAGPTATKSSNNIVVTAHQAIVENASGTWVCTSTASLTCPLETPLPAAGQSRWDLIVGEVVSGDYQLRSVTGTASSNPSVPGTPINTIALFRTRVTNAGPQEVIALYSWTRAPGGIRLCEDWDTRVGSFEGDLRRFKNGQIEAWVGGVWVPMVSPAAWTQWNPVLSYAGQGGNPSGTVNLGVNGQALGRYLVSGKRLDLAYTFFFGNSGINAGTGTISTTLPPGMTSRTGLETHVLCVLYTGNEGAQKLFSGACFLPPNSTVLQPRFPMNESYTGLGNLKAASAPGAAGTGIPQLPGKYPITTASVLSITGTIEIQ
ncbi:hypothetical protein [Pseudonocardia asaccharolytica]|uniref:Uncharacterized protein n=1 Tax=Pseudonocardia asaccharolytica DSM 44247 = NBRC 16224 TaxID=1123024 RepID=A0A511D3Y3_9PSEU|nr:hypothetical protein [Pseudonocardia asaccharolytica]GEL19367.1 hypothetical protein PA7_32040 [Pseudonocardia asaccharolytica DSM 44247 = NBRC 16224]